jgi:glycosyltransferase involved in cell wall biosynthesis
VRIALVTSYMPPHLGGIETIAQHLFEGYSAHGHEVRWFTSRVPSHLPPREGPIIRTACFNAAEDWLGVPVPLWGPGAVRDLWKIVGWADAVHVLECLYFSSALAVVLARIARRPVLLSQNIGFVPYESMLVRAIEHLAYRTLGRGVFRAASHVVLATPTAEAWVRRMYRGRVPAWASCFPVGIDTAMLCPAAAESRDAARAAFGFTQERPVALFAGRLVEKKGLPLVLETASFATDFDVAVAGDGPLRDWLRDASPNVRWFGAVDAPAMRALYAAADVVFLPSRGEGLPLVVQEAMSCGLPVVVSDDETFVEPLHRAGACVPAARNSLALHEALRFAVAHRHSVGAAARAFAEAHWTRDRMIARCESLLRRLL